MIVTPKLDFQLPGISELPLPEVDSLFFHRMDVAVMNMNRRNLEEIQQEESKAAKSVKGAWSVEEDQKLIEAVTNMHPILWDVVAESVPGRTGIQCKERYLYRLHPEVKKTRFEKWEDELIMKERMKIGNHWTLIATKLPGRTSCAVKNRWYSVLRNKCDVYSYLNQFYAGGDSSHSPQ